MFFSYLQQLVCESTSIFVAFNITGTASLILNFTYGVNMGLNRPSVQTVTTQHLLL